MMETAEQILHFWFEEPKTFEEKAHLWFGGTPEIDARIRSRYEPLVLAAERGELQAWATEPRSRLALILLLDQFPLNIYRDQPRSFQLIERALPLALDAVECGFDQRLKPIERVFAYLPIEHSERLDHQLQSVALFKRLVDEATPETREGMEIFHDYAVKHWEVIDRFGRYPDRNPILGREHTPEEAAYMEAGGPPF